VLHRGRVTVKESLSRTVGERRVVARSTAAEALAEALRPLAAAVEVDGELVRVEGLTAREIGACAAAASALALSELREERVDQRAPSALSHASGHVLTRRALRVEALKLASDARAARALTGTLCVGAALAVVQAALASAEAGVAQGPPVLDAVRAGQLGALGLGVICGGGEYRHETLDTLLAAFPRRGTVLLAKTTVLTLSAVVLALAATALGTGIGAVVLHARLASPSRWSMPRERAPAQTSAASDKPTWATTGRGSPRQTARGRGQAGLGQHRAPRVVTRRRERDPDPPRRRLQGAQRAPPEGAGSTLRARQAQRRSQRRALAGAVDAGQQHDPPGLDAQIEAIDDSAPPIALHQALDPQRRLSDRRPRVRLVHRCPVEGSVVLWSCA